MIRRLVMTGWRHDTRHIDQFFEKPVSLDFTFYQLDEMREYLEAAGFTLQVTTERAPYDEEHPSPRGYMRAQNIKA